MLAAIGGANLATWSVAALATGGVILRRWKLPEALSTVLGALVLVLTEPLPWRTAAALPVRLRLHRQRGELRAADQQPSRSGALPEPHGAPFNA